MANSFTIIDILEFLKSKSIMTLSTVSEDSRPHTAALLYTVDDDLNMYFVTHTDSQKVKNIARNKYVSLAVWEIKKMSLQIDGECEQVTDLKIQEEVIEQILNLKIVSKDFWPPFLKITGQAYTVFQIKPKTILCFDLSAPKTEKDNNPFIRINL